MTNTYQLWVVLEERDPYGKKINDEEAVLLLESKQKEISHKAFMTAQAATSVLIQHLYEDYSI